MALACSVPLIWQPCSMLPPITMLNPAAAYWWMTFIVGGHHAVMTNSSSMNGESQSSRGGRHGSS